MIIQRERNFKMSKTETYPVITISREYAAGGRSVARLLSEKTGLEWYDKDFVKDLAKESGYSEEDILAEGEELKNSAKILDSILNSMVSYTSSHDAIYQAQKEEVVKLSASPCIIVGRCANVILEEAGIPHFDVFLYADMDHRLAHAKDLAENGDEDLQKYVQTRDAYRANYYKHYTKKVLGDYHDYDLHINTGLFGYEQAVEMILDAISRK